MENIGQYAIPVLFMLFVVYRRFKRSIGFQPFKPHRLKLRIGIFSFIGLALLTAGFVHPILFGADALGLACGAVIAYYAIKHSKFEQRVDNLYYRTHIGIETFVVALFVGRLAYRFVVLFSMGQQPASANNPAQMQQMANDPWTAITFFLIIAYYIGYYTFVIRRSNQLNSSSV